jgi:beta-hydroxyacyl-ACP dehydratase FabZ
MQEILDHLPHRHPFLLIDKILEREEGSRVLAEKLVTIQEPWFQGHFPGRPIMPGVLLVEMMAQAGGFLENGSLIDKSIFLAQIIDARFKAPATPGDRLLANVALEARFGSLIRVAGAVICESKTICTAKLLLKRMEI